MNFKEFLFSKKKLNECGGGSNCGYYSGCSGSWTPSCDYSSHSRVETPAEKRKKRLAQNLDMVAKGRPEYKEAVKKLLARVSKVVKSVTDSQKEYQKYTDKYKATIKGRVDDSPAVSIELFSKLTSDVIRKDFENFVTQEERMTGINNLANKMKERDQNIGVTKTVKKDPQSSVPRIMDLTPEQHAKAKKRIEAIEQKVGRKLSAKEKELVAAITNKKI
jgi:hypothetical protein